MLFDSYKQANVPLTEAFDTSYPAYFLHPLAEYNALVNHAGIIDLTHWRVLTVTGNDRASFLHAMVTNDIIGIATGRGCHSTITTVKGKIIAELFVFARENDHLVLMPSGDLEEVISTLEKHIIAEDVTIADVSNEFGVLAVEGPKSEAIIKRLFLTGTLTLPKDRFDIVEGRFETFELPVINNTCTGDHGYQVIVPAAEVARIREYLVQAARGSDGWPVGLTAWNIRRAENGIPWLGIDYTNENFPPESRLDHTVSYTKGCFRGQETLGRIHNRGDVNRLLVGLAARPGERTAGAGRNTAPADVAAKLAAMTADVNRLMSRADENGLRARANSDAATFDVNSFFPPGSELFAGGDDDPAATTPKGRITSAVVSPRLGDCLLLGYVRREVLESNVEIELPRGKERETLSVINLPLVSRSG
jgi:folate-binding protein YgfZ